MLIHDHPPVTMYDDGTLNFNLFILFYFIAQVYVRVQQTGFLVLVVQTLQKAAIGTHKDQPAVVHG